MRYLLILITLFLLSALPVAAQSEATQLSDMTVELWPDYDRPAVLVLLTGTLPETATLPATVRIPLPDNADVFAVARFNDVDALISDVDASETDGGLTLTTPGRVFRVEYYVPYEADGSEYSYRFEWVSDLTIDNMATVVQQPRAATSMTVTPAPMTSAAERGDGLTYHRVTPQPLGAGQPYTVDIRYTVEAPVLSAPAVATVAPASTPAATGGLSDINPLWLLAIPALLLLVGGAWYLGRQQGGAAGRPRKPRSARPAATKGSAARFCHSCGRPAQPGDVFCRNCGTTLK